MNSRWQELTRKMCQAPPGSFRLEISGLIPICLVQFPFKLDTLLNQEKTASAWITFNFSTMTMDHSSIHILYFKYKPEVS